MELTNFVVDKLFLGVPPDQNMNYSGIPVDYNNNASGFQQGMDYMANGSNAPNESIQPGMMRGQMNTNTSNMNSYQMPYNQGKKESDNLNCSE